MESEKTRRVKQGNEGRLSLNGAVGKWVIEGKTDGKALMMARLFNLLSFE